MNKRIRSFATRFVIRRFMRKAVLKRIKFTKTGKVLRRRAGQNHFNAKMSRQTQLRQKKLAGFSKTWEKKIRAYSN